MTYDPAIDAGPSKKEFDPKAAQILYLGHLSHTSVCANGRAMVMTDSDAHSPAKTITLVVPVYNENQTLDALSSRIDGVIAQAPWYRWEVIYVNDGSRDGSEERLSHLSRQYGWLTVLHLSRNFGHQIAISAGLDYARGDAVILMDGDLQDPPELILGMLAKWEEGFDVVYATRQERIGESAFKRASAAVFYRFLSRLSDIEIPLDTGDFRLMGRPVVNALLRMPEKNRFIRGMVSWVGFRQTPIYYERAGRHDGETKFTLIKMVRFALDGLLSFSKIPLQWIASLGFAISAVSFIGILLVVYLKLFTRIHIEAGWSSLMIGILMLGGIQLISLGMLGEYVGRIFDEVRQRPLYLIKQIDGQARRHEILTERMYAHSNVETPLDEFPSKSQSAS